jgi:NitT/TauT family transport system substrate-binding protein
MGRLPTLARAALAPEGQAVWDRIAAVRDGVRDPYGTLIRMATRLALWSIITQIVLVVACASPAAAPSTKPAAAPPGSAAAPAAVAQPTAPAVASPAAVAPPPRQAIKYGYVPILASGAMFIAQDRGYFAEQGIDLDMVSFDSGALLIPAVSAGQLEAGHGTAGPALFNALAREINMKAVSVISWNGTFLMVRKDLADAGQIQTVQDLKGKRVSLMVEGSPIDFTMRRVLYQNGLSLGDLDVQRLSMPDSVPALGNGGVDAVTVVEPFPVLIESRGLGVRGPAVQDQVWKDAASLVLVGQGMLSRGDAANVAFMIGFVKGVRDLQAALQDERVADPGVLDIVSRWTKIAPDVVARAVISGAPPNGRLDLDDLNRQQDFWVQEGDVRTRADLGRFVEYRYLDAAVAQLP